MDEEDRRRRAVNGGEEPRAQLRRLVPTVARARENDRRSDNGIPLGLEHSERPAEGMSYDGDTSSVDFGQRAQKSEAGKGVADLPVFQQLQLNCVAHILPMGGEFGVHKVDAAGSLVGGEPNAAPEQIQKGVTMPREDRSECFGLPLVWAEPFKFLSRAATPVIEQDRRELPASAGPPEQTAQLSRAAPYHDGARPGHPTAFSLNGDGLNQSR
jgi:hypothetical protein